MDSIIYCKKSLWFDRSTIILPERIIPNGYLKYMHTCKGYYYVPKDEVSTN